MDDFLATSFLGNKISTWLMAAAFMLGGFFAGKIISWLTANILKRISSKTKTRIDDIILSISEKPLVLIITVAGIALGIEQLSMNPEVNAFVDKSFMVLLTFTVAWTLNRLMESIINEYVLPFVQQTEGDLDDQLLPILRTGGTFLIWILAVIFALKNIGYDVGALLAGLGLGGVAIALAAKDTLSNFFGSVSVFVDRPFKINDRVKIAGYDGWIQEIGIRTSRLKTLDNRIVTIPNSVFTAGPIENVTSEPHTKITQIIDLARSNNVEKLSRSIQIMEEVGKQTEGTTGDPIAGIANIGEYSYKTTFVYYVAKSAPYLKTLHEVNMGVLSRLEAEGIALAYPVRTMITEQVSQEK